MSSFIRSQSAAEILRNAAYLYRTHFWVLFLAYLLPMAPFLVADGAAQASGSKALAGAVDLVMFLALSLATFPTTVVLSDICLGNEPDLRRAFRLLAADSIGKTLGTYILSIVICLLGFVLLVVPGLVFCAWYAFVIPVTVLEANWGWKALQRSKSLGKGHYWRIFGTLLVCTSVVLIVALLLGIVLGFIASRIGVPMLPTLIVGNILSCLPNPMVSIVTVLLYYDLRARKEAYDSAALAEDLKH